MGAGLILSAKAKLVLNSIHTSKKPYSSIDSHTLSKVTPAMKAEC